MGNSLNLIFASITFLVFSLVLLTYNPIIFVIFFCGNIIYGLWVLSALRFRKKFDWQNFELTSKNQSYWVETISSIQDIKTNNYEIHRRWEWESIQAQLFKVNQRVLVLNNVQVTGAQFISSLTNLFITFYCAKAVIRGEITFGVMISTQFIIGMLSGPVAQFITYIQSYQYAKISYERLNEINDLQDEENLTSGTNNLELPQFKSLVVKNVSFQYSPNAPLTLKHISFVIPENCITAIVGNSGSGKSTLLKLLLRLYQPTFGDIQIGNMNVNNINLKYWREKCASVMQDGKIFNDTILNNIVLGDEQVDYVRLKDCVTAANIIKEIEEFPQGYNTLLGEVGRGISGGQKQRLLIARALYKNPDYLFLDEATNSLDSINEQKIVEALDTIFTNKTVVIVAHRLSTIQRANQIIVLKSGSIAETGNHDSLMKRKGHYYELVESQSRKETYVE
jgi:ATP-binding cassette subfamily B protein